MTKLETQLRSYIEAQLPRVLTQMDRDPDSPTFGCFDRNYWHYKIRDFPSGLLQQGLYTLEAMRRETIGHGPFEDKWCLAALNALARQVDRRGALDEYYPYERSYPASVFALWAACRVLNEWRETECELIDEFRNWEALQRLAVYVASRTETQAMNQQAAGLAGMAIAVKLGCSVIGLEQHASRFFESQNEEGWFNEYGGPDFGYLSVTLDALADYHDATGDTRALKSADQAIAFIANFIGADGRLPATLNSRNTDYFVPYGLVRAAARNPTASWLTETIFADVNQPTHSLWATDDRYHCHYIYASAVRCLPWIKRMQPPVKPASREVIWLPQCGWFAHHSADQRTTLFVASRKGGIIRIHRAGDLLAQCDNGWRIEDGQSRWTTNWQSEHWQVELKDSTLSVAGKSQRIAWLTPNPLSHVGLRVLAKLFGEKLVPYLKSRMIFRKKAADGPLFVRRIEIGAGKLTVSDKFDPVASATAYTAPRQNTRHVASADSFSPEELGAPMFPESRQPLDKGLSVEHRISF